MNLHSIIKRIVYCLLVVFTLNVNAQTEEVVKETIENNDTIVNSRQRNVAYSIGYHNPIPSGDNFIGKGLEGNGGLDFKIQVYVYKQFFIGASLGASYFKVKDQSLVGNYQKTRILENYFFVGYEFIPSENFRVGLTASVYGDSNYKNKFSNDDNQPFQKDSARLNSYGVYLTYEISSQFMVYLDYAYRIEKTDINVPALLEDTFRRGTFNQIGIGLKFSFKGKDLVSSL